MDQKITIKGRDFYYTPQKLTYENEHPIDVNVAKENLLLFNKVAKANDFEFILFFGTLLGAIREKGFIKHDTDIDLVTTNENKLLDIIPQLQQNGFKFVRYYVHEHNVIYSFSRNGVYLDVYLAEKNGSKEYFVSRLKIPKTFIENLKTISFLNDSFFISAKYEKFLILHYGKDWRIPKKNFHGFANKPKLFYRLADFFPKKLRNFVKKILGIKK